MVHIQVIANTYMSADCFYFANCLYQPLTVSIMEILKVCVYTITLH